MKEETKKREIAKTIITPEPGYVVVLPDPKKDNIGGVIVPSISQLDSKEGTVMWVPTIGHETLKMGDRVIFHSNSGIRKTLDDGEEYMIMKNIEIFAKLQTATVEVEE
jgi:co-chaperonin GroES (HSP10)